jgi:hypothetical protein
MLAHMNTWYLKDTRGNVVGPLSRDVAVDLLRSRPGVFLHTSQDGGAWMPVRGGAVATLVSAEDPPARRVREHQEAQRALLELDRFRELEAHYLFGVPKTATLKDYRKGFLTLGKRYHPARLPNDVSPELLRANMAVYQYLTEVLNALEVRFGAHPAVPVIAPVASAPRPLPPVQRPSAPRPEQALPTWQLEALRLRREHEQLLGQFQVTRQTAFVFSAHRLMNLSNEAVFFPCLPALALGTRLGLTFNFEEAGRAVELRGAVALENSTSGGPLGFGVRLDLRPTDKTFMLGESQRLLSAR